MSIIRSCYKLHSSSRINMLKWINLKLYYKDLKVII